MQGGTALPTTFDNFRLELLFIFLSNKHLDSCVVRRRGEILQLLINGARGSDTITLEALLCRAGLGCEYRDLLNALSDECLLFGNPSFDELYDFLWLSCCS